MTKMRALSAGVACAAILATPVLVRAQSQPWLGDRRFGGGIGVRAGDLELHPGIAGEIGYDSNFFQASGVVTPPNTSAIIPLEFRPVSPGGGSFGAQGTFSEPIIDTFRFRITPSLTLNTLGPQRTGEGDGEGEPAPPKLNFQATLSASYNELVSLESDYSDAVADRRFLTGEATLALDILPQRPWGVGLNGRYMREVQPVNDPTAPPGYQRSTFGGGGALKWRPGGGLLEWSAGYDLTYVMFEDEGFANFTSLTHAFKLKGRWLFLPRTALLYSGEYGLIDYPDGGRVKTAGNPLSSTLGINGLVTNHLAALAVAGWKTLFFEQDGEFDSFIANAELTWYPLPRPDLDPMAAGVGLSSISLGYRRDAMASYVGNFVQYDSAYVKASYFFGGSLLVSLNGSFDHLQRPEGFFSDRTRQTPAFSENRVSVTGFGEYRTSDTFGINTTLRYTSALTDQLVPLSNDPADATVPYDDFGFARFEAWLGVRWFL